MATSSFAKPRRAKGEGTVFQRPNGKFTAAVDFGRNEAGKRQRRAIYGDTKEDVIKQLRKIQRDRDCGITLGGRDGRTLAEFCRDRLKDEYVLGLERGSQDELERTFRVHIEPFIGFIRLDRFDGDEVADLFKQLRTNGRSPRTLKKVYNFLNAAFRKGLRTRRVSENPMGSFDAPRYKAKEFTPLSREEIERFVHECAGNENEALFTVSLFTGMRQGEIRALKWRNIDFKNQMLSVRHSVSFVQSELVVKDPKNKASRRSIALADAVLAALEAHRERMRAKHGTLPEFVFVNDTGGQLRPETLRRAFKFVLAAARIPLTTRLHDLRHTFATLLLSENIHPKVVMEMLGHTRIATTMDLYSHTLPTMQKSAIDAINKNIGIKQRTKGE